MKKNTIDYILSSVDTHGPASHDAIATLEQQINASLPPSYRDLLLRSNGLEGFIGNNYLVLWPIEEIIELNAAYGVSEFAPGILLIGSNGGGSGYAIDYRDCRMTFVEVPFIGMSLDDLEVKGYSVIELLSNLNE